MIFFTADLHFGHDKILEYCKRPFQTVEEMNEQLIISWNSRVGTHDTVYVLGDLALCPYREFSPIAMLLNGKKVLVKGNHDKYSAGQYKKLGFDLVYELKLKLCGKMVRLSHYPYAIPWYKRLFAYKSELRFMDHRPPKVEGEILFHGHTHMKYKQRDNMIHVGVDAWDFCPVSLHELESYLNK